MPSFEAKVLSDFLVEPAPLREFMTLNQFTQLFGNSQSSPAIKPLYRELYTAREKDIETVRQHIAEEIQRSKRVKHAYARSRRRKDEANVAGLDRRELRMEEELSNYRRQQPHTLETVHASVEQACVSLESQIAEMEEENQATLLEIKEIIGSLSDLRHGHFAQATSGEDLAGEVIAALKGLEAACTRAAG